MRGLPFALSSAPLVLLAVACLIAPDATGSLVKSGFDLSAAWFGGPWQVLFVAYGLGAVALAASPWGKARLGLGPPEYTFAGWVAVLVCTLLAGGGVFWVCAEPMFHFTTPPPAFDVATGTREAATVALAQAHFHWGFFAWAMVGTLGAVSLAASHWLDGLAFRPRALLAPLTGELPETVGHLADAVAIVAVIAGTVGPIGFLALQLSNAAEGLLGIPDGYATQIVVLLALVALYTASAASGLQRGIAWLSRANVIGAIGLGLVVLVLGPTGFILSIGLDSFGTYLASIPSMAFFRADTGWLSWWTVFFWGWFLGFAPMMSVFVARISRGRTVRELVLAVAVAAPLVTHMWFIVVGGTSLFLELDQPGVISGPLSDEGMAAAMLATLSQLPGQALLIPLFVLLVFCFLATTGDSVAFAVSVVLSGADDPPVGLRIFWAVAMGVLAAALLGVGQQGIDALQQFIVITAVPVTFLVVPTLVTGPMGARRLYQQQQES
ncbi:MAG: BCCT family transporter [Myxococcota bacterium]